MGNLKIYRNIAKLRDVELFYLDTNTDGPVIICLHGRWGRAETWAHFMQRYGKQYRVIAPDQRGHGLSGKPDSAYTGEEMAGDIAALMDDLRIPSAIVVGHSMGGRIAGYLAAMHPELVSALAILDKSAAASVQSRRLSPGEEPVDPVTKDWPLPFSTLSEARDFIAENMDSELSIQYFINSLCETAEGIDVLFSPQAMAKNVVNDTDWFHLLPQIKCPVLLLRAKKGGAVTDGDFAKMQSLLINSMACEASNPNHNVHLSDKEEFYGYFDAFLRTLPDSL